MLRARARCLTLMLAPFTLSHRHAIFGLWMSLSACLSLPRARGGRRRLSKVFRAFQPSWLADDFRRGVRHQTSSLARLDGKRWTQFRVAREGGRSQTGETPPVVSAASRPHSEITGNGLDTPAIRLRARRSAGWSGSQHRRARTSATRPTNPRPREINFGLRTADMKDASR